MDFFKSVTPECVFIMHLGCCVRHSQPPPPINITETHTLLAIVYPLVKEGYMEADFDGLLSCGINKKTNHLSRFADDQTRVIIEYEKYY